MLLKKKKHFKTTAPYLHPFVKLHIQGHPIRQLINFEILHHLIIWLNI